MGSPVKNKHSTEAPRRRPGGPSLPPGLLVEVSGSLDACARTTVAVELLRQAQGRGEACVWIQPTGGPLYPPDLHDSAIDLDALTVVHIPRHRDSRRITQDMFKAAEVLLRSGAFGAMVIDLTEDAPRFDIAWQQRILGLSRKHRSHVLVLTNSSVQQSSLGPLIGLRIEPHRTRIKPGLFAIDYDILKNKSGKNLEELSGFWRGPWGLS